MADDYGPIDAHVAIWRPGAKEHRLTGVFTWDDNGGVARVNGHLQDDVVPGVRLHHLHDEHDMLHARLEGKNYTFLDCTESRGGFMGGDESMWTATIRCGFVIAGVLLDSREDLFSALRFRMDAADTWIGRSSIRREDHWKPNIRSEVTYEAREPDHAGAWTLTDGVTTHVADNPHSVVTTALTTFVYRPPDGLTVDQAIDTVFAVERLMAVCTGRTAPVNNVSLDHLTETRGTNIDGNPAPRQHAVRFEPTPLSAPSKRDNFPPITLTALDGAAALDPWILRFAELRSVVNMVVADQAGEIPYLEQRYLTNALGAELLDSHNRSAEPDGDARSNPQHFAALTAQVLAAVDIDDRDELGLIMRFANTPPLFERLRRLAESADPDRDWFFHGVKHGRWAQVAGRVRNLLTHSDGAASEDRAEALYWLNASLRWVVIVNLVAPLGDNVAAQLLTSSGARNASSRLPDSIETFESYFKSL